MAELADAGDLKSPGPKGRVGSIPTLGIAYARDAAAYSHARMRFVTANDVLLENHRRFLAFLEKRVGDRAVAEDILQDAFVRNLAKVGDMPAEGVVPWFYTTLRNAVIDRHRRDAARGRALEAFAREVQRGQEAAGETAREICACVTRVASTLKPEYAEVLARVDVGGASLKEYASQSGLTPNTAAVRAHRARQALRLRLMESCGLCADHGCADCSCGSR